MVINAEAFEHFHRPKLVEPETVEDAPELVEAGDLDVDQTAETAEGPGWYPSDDERAAMVAAGDRPILGSPSISLAAFQSVLQAAGSPATAEAASIYQAFTAQGVDPAVGLAIYQHESGFGKSGVAVKTKSLGNSRYYGTAGTTKYQTATNGSFAAYPSFTAAAADLARLLSGPLYGQSSNHNTVLTFASRYAPAADHNDPAGYGRSVLALIAKWSGQPAPTIDAHQAHVLHLAASGGLTGGPLRSASNPSDPSTAKAPGINASIASATASLKSSTILTPTVILAIGGVALLIVVLIVLRSSRTKPIPVVRIAKDDDA